MIKLFQHVPTLSKSCARATLTLSKVFKLLVEELLNFSDVLKHKVVAHIAGYLAHKHKIALKSGEDAISTEFIYELNRGGLCVPTFEIFFFCPLRYLVV